MSALHTAQVKFAHLLPRLLDHAFSEGYEAVVGEVWRPQVTADYYASRGLGAPNSLHMLKLAVDLSLFKDGTYLKYTDQYLFLGLFWEAQDPDCAWGGRFVNRPDGGHFSLAWDGRR